MTFLERHYGRDYSTASPEELEALKAENEARAAAAERENRAVVDHMPVWLNMTNTTRCNLRCIMCNQAYGKTRIMVMEPGIYETVVRRFYPFLRTVQLTAIGEPMMTPALPSKIDDMLRYGVRLEMVTNGTLLKGDRLLERLARVAELVTVSLDGARPETFNALRRGADFDAILENLRRFNRFRLARPEAERPALHFNYILMRRNIRELPEFVDLAADLGAQAVVCTHLVLFDRSMEGEMLARHPELSNRYTAEAARRAEERGVRIDLPPPFPVPRRKGPSPELPPPAREGEKEARRGPPPDDGGNEAGSVGEYRGERCYFLWRRVYIGPHGEVVPCCLSGVAAMGNLKERPFPGIWNGEGYVTLRRRVHTLRPPPPCDRCYLINRNPSRGAFEKA